MMKLFLFSLLFVVSYCGSDITYEYYNATDCSGTPYLELTVNVGCQDGTDLECTSSTITGISYTNSDCTGAETGTSSIDNGVCLLGTKVTCGASAWKLGFVAVMVLIASLIQ
mmetsp:Transcript_64237/g.57753  ORF Transcript_64237/g.57753 Transcript_64237/m.57753 type:complete len:112 (-) Transcript_64237:373-708(-)